MASILITGASGVIGTALMASLDEDEHDIIGIDKNESRWFPDRVRTHDLRNDAPLPETDVIVHLAAHSQVQAVLDDTTLAVDNIAMTERVLDHARETESHVIFSSSREVFGSRIQPRDNEVTINAVNPYAASKIASESLAHSFANCFDIDTTTLRFTNIYGPYDTNQRLIPKFIALGLNGEPLPVYGTGKLLDFIYLEDVITAIKCAIDRRRELSNEAITVGSGRGTALTDVATMLTELIDECPGYEIHSDRTGDTAKFVADSRRADSLLSVEPRSLAEGLDETIRWYRSNSDVVAELFGD